MSLPGEGEEEKAQAGWQRPRCFSGLALSPGSPELTTIRGGRSARSEREQDAEMGCCSQN